MPAIEIGQVEALYRYPVKSMRGEAVDAAELGWHGVEGDRRFALHRMGKRGGFPWLTASKLPDLVRFTPMGEPAPTHVRTPEGQELPLFGEALAAELGRRFGAPVEVMQLGHGVFDDATLSVITAETVAELGRLSGTGADVRRFRPNVVIRSTGVAPFGEDAWVGGLLTFGGGEGPPAVSVTMRDIRCSMVNIDPDRGTLDAEVLKAVVRANQNGAGIYGTVTRVGRLAVGQTVTLHR